MYKIIVVGGVVDVDPDRKTAKGIMLKKTATGCLRN